MKATTLLVFLSVVAASGCLRQTTRSHVSGGRFLAETKYVHPVMTPDECAALDDPFVNCEPSVTFHPNGTAELKVTDIVNTATYSIDGGHISLEIDGGDVRSFRFRFGLSQGELIDDVEGWTWTLARKETRQRLALRD